MSDAQPVEAAGPRPALDKKKTAIMAVVGIVTLILIFVKVIPQIGSYEDAFVAIQAMDAFDIVVIAITVLIYNTVYGFPFMTAVPGLAYPRSFQLNQGAFAISNGVPAGGAFGLAVLVTMIVIFALIMRSEPLAIKIGGWGNTLARPVFKVVKKDAPDLVPVVVKFRTDTVSLVTRRWHVITVSQVAVSLCQFAIFFAALRGVEGGSDVTPFLVAFGAWAVAQIGIMIPITPGGLGTVDAFMISLLTAMGVSDGDATAADLVWRASSFVPQIIIGVVMLVTWSRTAARKFAVAKPADAAA